MTRTRDQQGIGTAGGLAALFAVVVIAQMSFPFLGNQPGGWVAGAPGVSADPLHRAVAGAHETVLDDLIGAGFSPDGLARESGVFRAVVSGTERDRVEFIADIDSDGRSDLLRWEVREGELVRTLLSRTGDDWIPASSHVVARGVDEFRLSFLDGNRAPVPADRVVRGDGVRSVQVSLRLAQETDIGRAVESFSGEVALRNHAG